MCFWLISWQFAARLSWQGAPPTRPRPPAGFTGAQASPLQCAPLADSCLAYGAASCRRAKEVLEAAAAEGRLAPHGAGARVIYGHTDSLFVLLPEARDVPAAIQAGKLAGKVRHAGRALRGDTSSAAAAVLAAKAGAGQAQAAAHSHQACCLGAALQVVSAAFPPPMELKFERVCLPLMLLHVNRHGGAQPSGEGASAAPLPAGGWSC